MSNDSHQGQLLQELLDIDRRIIQAIGAKDRHQLAPLLAESFTLKTPGAPDVTREAFLEAVAALPGEILSIGGLETAALVIGEAGIVSGVQVAEVRLEDTGTVVTSRGAYTDIFERHDGRWRLRFAFSIELPASAANPAPVSGTS
jgi:hypothetical protein